MFYTVIEEDKCQKYRYFLLIEKFQKCDYDCLTLSIIR